MNFRQVYILLVVRCRSRLHNISLFLLICYALKVLICPGAVYAEDFLAQQALR